MSRPPSRWYLVPYVPWRSDGAIRSSHRFRNESRKAMLDGESPISRRSSTPSERHKYCVYMCQLVGLPHVVDDHTRTTALIHPLTHTHAYACTIRTSFLLSISLFLAALAASFSSSSSPTLTSHLSLSEERKSSRLVSCGGGQKKQDNEKTARDQHQQAHVTTTDIAVL